MVARRYEIYLRVLKNISQVSAANKYFFNTRSEDNMLFSHVKISSFRAKAHLVFHWCSYNKFKYLPSQFGPVNAAGQVHW